LDEREFELINIIGAKLGSNQRDLSRHMDLSLGQTNMLVRRLVSKGYIRISQLNKKKLKYILTPKGITEKTRKSVKYTLNTINSFGLIREKLKVIILELYEKNERDFTILGKSDLGFFTEMVFKDMGLADCKISYIDELSEDKIEGILLICKENQTTDTMENTKAINLVHELANDITFINHNSNTRMKDVE